MKPATVKDRLNKIATKKQSKWLEKLEWREANEAWLDKSAEIAFKVLRALRAKPMSQKDLANKLNVSPQYISKVLKGSENLSLETISKLEHVLGIELITIAPSYYSSSELITNFAYSLHDRVSSKDTKSASSKKYGGAVQTATYQPDENQTMAA